jgi:hypothetical protein
MLGRPNYSHLTGQVPQKRRGAALLASGGGSMKEIKFGNVSVTRVVEYHGDAGTSPEDITPGLPVELWRENRSWLQPDHVNADFTSYVGARVLRTDSGFRPSRTPPT